MIKLVALDLDGTLLDSNDNVSIENINAIKTLPSLGVLPVVVTGRIESEARFAYEPIGATRYFVGANGAQTINLETGSVIYTQKVSQNTATKVINFLDGLDIFYQAYSENNVFCTKKSFSKIDDVGLSKGYLEQNKRNIETVSSFV